VHDALGRLDLARRRRPRQSRHVQPLDLLRGGPLVVEDVIPQRSLGVAQGEGSGRHSSSAPAGSSVECRGLVVIVKGLHELLHPALPGFAAFSQLRSPTCRWWRRSAVVSCSADIDFRYRWLNRGISPPRVILLRFGIPELNRLEGCKLPVQIRIITPGRSCPPRVTTCAPGSRVRRGLCGPMSSPLGETVAEEVSHMRLTAA
jgi:hypothetical protein